ncbi:TlpA disulfide reductase family protein [Pontibacter sp. G13]|uniref:TlpA family protein disulfide reductase n=1 Tax=Pontibacter sp. G13 TaxID=3074898 RepID=UPI00288A4D8F|nr:TlpA disulfide reductase family protein [Pontibacter sp. G13]WNJ20366.1 TlpA disulfide reductase family protein [Pontibacter sp. G13]
MNRFFLLSLPIVLSLGLVSSCLDRSTLWAQSPSLPGEIVLIFDHPNISDSYQISSHPSKSGMTPKRSVIWYDALGDLNMHHVPKEASYDTLVISTSSEWQEVSLHYEVLRVIPYWLKNGDTARITYDGLKPQVAILNRETLPYDLNWAFWVDERVGRDSMPATTRIGHESFQLNYFLHNRTKVKSANFLMAHDQEVYPQASREWKKERSILDSVMERKLIDPSIYAFRRQQLRFDSLRMEFTQQRLALGIEVLNLPKEAPQTHAFHQMLYSYSTGVRRKRKLDGQPKMSSTELFDLFFVSEEWSVDAKYHLLKLIFEGIKRTETSAEVVRYSEKLNQLNGKDWASGQDWDPVWAESLSLVDESGDTALLADLLAKYQGQVIFLDFWSSTCAPCLKEMPASATIRDQFEGDPVAFIYISFDLTDQVWERTSQRIGLQGWEEHYRSISESDNSFVSELGIDYIPRYLLIGGDGSLIYSHAPKPSDPALATAIQTEIQHLR